MNSTAVSLALCSGVLFTSEKEKEEIYFNECLLCH